MLSRRTLYQVHVPGSRSFTAGVVIQDGRVVKAAPILRRFVGQEFSALQWWVRRERGEVTAVAHLA